jgi:hypothetical protein
VHGSTNNGHKWKYFLTSHANKQFRSRAGQLVFEPRCCQLVETENMTDPQLIEIANMEVDRGVLIDGPERMYIAGIWTQRHGRLPVLGDDRLIVFDYNAWVLRGDTIVTYLEVSPDMLEALKWPKESMWLVAHNQVCAYVLPGYFGDKVTTHQELDDALRIIVRNGERVHTCETGVSCFRGTFHAEHATGDGAVRRWRLTVLCEIIAGTCGHIVRWVEIEESVPVGA